jgi:L,D-transpeptidase ErfK/SrfK
MRFLLILWILLSGCSAAQVLSPVVGTDREYQTKPGDNLYSVARAHGLALEHLAFANGLPVSLNPVKKSHLKLPERRILPTNPPKDGLVLNLPERGIYLFRGGEYQGFYPVAIGQLGWYTPVGDFTIANRTVNPTWYPPAWAGVAGPVGPGPANPLGDRWMGLSYGGYGIHSTNRPDSIGGAVSHGCIRMYPESVRKLYELVRVGMPIRIEYEPVKIGADESGQIFLVAFPDVYQRRQRLKDLQSLLQKHGLNECLTDQQARTILARSSGLAEPVIGRIVHFEGDRYLGMIHQERLYLSEELFGKSGMEIETTDTTLQIGQKRMVLAAPILNRHGGFRWDPKTSTLERGPERTTPHR